MKRSLVELGMTICRCVWPDCDSRFPSARGPAIPGWKSYVEPGSWIVLCPFHSDLGHAPRLARYTSGGNPSRFGCVCGDWLSERIGNLTAGVHEWIGHVRTSVTV